MLSRYAAPSARALHTSSRSLAGLFSHVEQYPKDPILGVTENFLQDKNPSKINLGVVRLIDQSRTGFNACVYVCSDTPLPAGRIS